MVSANFSRDEFKCKCGCGFAAVDIELLYVLEDLRAHFNSPVIITSGCRCIKHNSNIGGAPASMHIFGMAADVCVHGTHSKFVADYLRNEYPNKYGIGEYAGWVHIDVRENKARWVK